MRVFKVTVHDGANPFICENVDQLLEFLKPEFQNLLSEDNKNDTISISLIEMDEEKYRGLREWDGP